MNCSEWSTELIECVRRDGNPDGALRSHLSSCAGCRERWDVERQLSEQFQIMRVQTSALGSPRARRESLMRDFARTRNLRQTHRRSPVRSVVWSLSAAAALLLAVFAGHEAGLRLPHPASPGTRANGAWTDQTVIYETSLGLSNDASALSSDDFIAIPYTPPLAPGEIVRMVQTDLSADALANMGVNVDPSWAGDVQADVVVGEDGVPRAVRITGTGQ